MTQEIKNKSLPLLSVNAQAQRTRCRVRDLGVHIGFFPSGKFNAITDVAGVKVGHATLIEGEGRLVIGKGPVRTGVTAIIPGENIYYDRLVGGGFVLNGAGEITGFTQVMEWGMIETPILLTNTLSVGTCAEAVVKYMVRKYPSIGQEHDVIIPLVGECDDSWLNDIAGRHVKEEHVLSAIEAAKSGPVMEGNVGAGTGMVTCDFSGGIGTASRRLNVGAGIGPFTVGVLVMSNFGRMNDLRFDGIPAGRLISEKFDKLTRRESIDGSIIAVLATDAPLMTHQLNRLCKRVALGIGRTGSYAAHGSGEIIMAFTTANKMPRQRKKEIVTMRVLPDNLLDPFYRAVVEATEEAILNALCMGNEIVGAYKRIAPALPIEDIKKILSQYQIPQTKIKKADLVVKTEQAGPAHQVGTIIKKS
ncbi:MAG: P1 family peptidase [bacterium]|nr:P1 family peptidase [bacterium]MBU1917711.1 P1 family peptidase [bacterium]